MMFKPLKKSLETALKEIEAYLKLHGKYADAGPEDIVIDDSINYDELLFIAAVIDQVDHTTVS